MPYYRILALPEGEKRDAEGRALGDDWPIADLGEDDDGTHYWITTDQVQVSETPALGDIAEQAAVMVAALNADVEAHGRERMSGIRITVGDGGRR